MMTAKVQGDDSSLQQQERERDVLQVTIESPFTCTVSDEHLAIAAYELKVPNELLCKWYNDCATGSEIIKALNRAIPDNCFAVREDCERVMELLRTRCSKFHATTTAHTVAISKNYLTRVQQ